MSEYDDVGIDYTDTGEAIEALAGDCWWCPQCNVEVPPTHVTFMERHDERAGGCGGVVLSVPPDAAIRKEAGK